MTAITADLKAVKAQTKKLRVACQTQGIEWITALCAPQIQALANAGALQMSLFDKQDLAEIIYADVPASRSENARKESPCAWAKCWGDWLSRRLPHRKLQNVLGTRDKPRETPIAHALVRRLARN
ncbi:MAG: hypothetical protein JNN08_10580 [Bryobacterales bacterium]|nr:hypothetical protein [Bryobacterales bacterium]